MNKSISFRWVLIPVAIFLLAFYFIVDPVNTTWIPQCIFHKVTGLQCMGCGAQRMAHALLHGDFTTAFHANAFLFCSLPFLAFLLWLEIFRQKYPRLYAVAHSLPVIITVAATLLAWLLIRNLLGL